MASEDELPRDASNSEENEKNDSKDSSELSLPNIATPNNTELYNFLHVSKTATQEEITTAYRKLCRLYHPDKHNRDEEKKKYAEVMQQKLQNAYEILKDPHKRAVYDSLGQEGIDGKMWEVIPRTKSPSAIREEFERLKKDREERMLESRTNPTSTLKVGINATDLFERYMYDEIYDDVIEPSLPYLEVTEVSIGQSIEAPLSLTDKLVLSGHVSSYNGKGSGSVSCALHRTNSRNAWQQFEASIGNGPFLGGKMYRKLTTNTYITFSGGVNIYSGGLRPSCDVTVGNTLSKNLRGYLSYGVNYDCEDDNDAFYITEQGSGMKTMVVFNSPSFDVTSVFQIGVPYSFLTVNLTKKFKTSDAKLRNTMTIGTFGAVFKYGIERKISSQSVLKATMEVGIPSGVTLTIRLDRASQAYTFPLHLSDQILFQPLFYGTVTPLLAWFALKKLLLDPWEARKKAKINERNQEEKSKKLFEAKKEAAHSVELMRERYNGICSDETAKNGLIIVVALYGKLLNETNEFLPEVNAVMESATSLEAVQVETVLASHSEIIDVTIAVQCLVEEPSKLVLYEGSKIGLAGFFDPCFASEDAKHLLIRYLYQGRLHQVLIQDNEQLRCPRLAHQLQALDPN